MKQRGFPIDDPFGTGLATREEAAEIEDAAEKPKKRSKKKEAVDVFVQQCERLQLPNFQREFYFAKSIGRRWRFDVCFVDHKIAVEIEGLVVRRLAGELVVQGRHASISGFKEDCIKYATAAALGWCVIRFEQSQVADKTAIDLAQRVLHARGWRPDLDG